MTNQDVSVIAVDDNEAFTKLVEAFLNQDMEADVEHYEDPENVLSEVVEDGSISDYDVVVSDWNMGRMNGGELGQKIREYSDIPIIYFTSESESDIDEVIADVGAQYLDKDDYGSLTGEVQDLLRERRDSNEAVEGYAGNWDTTVTETESDDLEAYVD